MNDDAGALLIHGDKLQLRPFLPGDITTAYLSWLNDPFTMRWSNQRFTRHTTESCLRYLHSFDSSPNLFLSISSLTGQALGTMTAYVAPHHRTADMGILIGERSVWGQGFGLDAWQTLLRWLLEQRGLRKVTAGTLSCNQAMLRLMNKSGMHLEGCRRQQELVDGMAHDICYFARFGVD